MKYERVDLGMGMGIRAGAGSDRLRTIWTPEMDRYFIDLMLEQVGKWSNDDDHIFSKQSWKHMACLFNDKFKFQHDIDIFKNRHKTLRNLYRSVQHLLDQEGFSWDETRKMVTADNKIWDEYIKVHPKLRSFRIKSIPYFRDLCEIYKHASPEKKVTIACHSAFSKDSEPQSDSGSMSEGENSKSELVKAEEPIISPINVGDNAMETLHDIALIEDYGLSVTTGLVDDAPYPLSDNSSPAATRTRTCWQPQMDLYFIHLMLDQVKKGNRADGLFRREAWMEMITSFNAKFGFNYEVDILKNRFKSLRRQYSLINNLLKMDGFVWDDARQMVTADDRVWQDYIKINTTARQYMTRPVPFYKDLCVICGEVSSDGKDGFSAHNTNQQDEAFENNFGVLLKSLESPSAMVFSDDRISKEDSLHMGFNATDKRGKHQLDNPSGSERSKRARSKDDGIAYALREMASTVSSLVGKRKEDESSNSVSIEHVVKAIQALPDMDEDLVLDACDFLEDEKRAKTFLALDFKLRKKWLIRKLRPQQQ
ncbi:L10-interacting MYB domain-containing protein [Ipomoea triloba]|uniref:L10-interacting MYB domain-containing protein n=1 Tax=Ipomoea triloba TaxID=35885 RepID=UPI00125D0E63|nr:L10-interacting MYB domain-containing protein [Ipomoea triloba]